MAESKKVHNFAIQGPTDKKICFRLFFVLTLYIKFQVPSSSSSLVLQPTKGVTDRRTDGQTDGPKAICPLNFFEVGGIKNVLIYCWIDREGFPVVAWRSPVSISRPYSDFLYPNRAAPTTRPRRSSRYISWERCN